MADEQRGFPIHELWEKYEDITMHFNDLIIRLRTQALAGVAALSTLVGIFAKTDLFGYSWEIAGLVFIALAAFWIAIWILDFGYYNKLLIGSVAALVEIEKASKASNTVSEINLSALVEKSVAGDLKLVLSRRQKRNIVFGRWSFYVIVLLALIAGSCFSFYIYLHPTTLPK